jgi:DNA-directed RNA polymerase specialized sigma24 family protein
LRPRIRRIASISRGALAVDAPTHRAWSMPARHDYEALFIDHLPFIERTIAAVTRVLALKGDDAEEYASWAKERLWDDDYLLLRKWREDSKLTTYLGVVLTNLGREFRVRRWGRWRPSAAALRLGHLGVRLETLVHRDGMRVEEAAELLRTRRETDKSDGEIKKIVAALPPRARSRRTEDAEIAAETIPADDQADAFTTTREALEERDTVYRTLRDAVGALTPEERVVITMHYFGGRSLADVARAVDVPQKPLYRLRDGALRRLRAQLAASGVTWEHVQGFFDGPLADTDGADGEIAIARPSMTVPDPEPTTDAHRASSATPRERLST